MSIETTNCRSDTGITSGLIDALISICRVLVPRLKAHEREEKNLGFLWFTALCPALQDLTGDEDLAYILGTMNRIALDIRKAYPEWPGSCCKMISSKGLPLRQCGLDHFPWEPCPSIAAFEEGKCER
jgi:hypothetical protein